ncbi:hypothetical protein FACS1894202_08050 [Clostridia bacterium]|nr:hypothetical protein FACS1894202_08050 [Clostridia bacterium]
MKKRVISLLIALCLTLWFVPFSLADEALTDGPLIVAPDVPSPWAQTELYIAGVYGIPELSGWTKPVDADEFAALIEAVGGTPSSIAVPTRGDTVAELAKVIAAELKVKVDDPAAYFVTNKLIYGRTLPDGKTDLALSEPITAQEAVILAKRAYEHIRYALGEDSKALLWKVSDEDNTVYLLGSVHIVTPDAYPLSKAVMAAWAESEILVEELDLTDIEAIANALLDAIYYSDGGTLSDDVSAETYTALVEFLEAFGLPGDSYDEIKPWYVAQDLQSGIFAQLIASGELTSGADQFFTDIRGNRPIIALETAEFQYGMLSGIGKEYDEYNILTSLAAYTDEDDYAEFVGSLYDMIAAWHAGDEGALQKSLAETDEDHAALLADYRDKLSTKRNGPMTEKITKFLTDDKVNDYFVVVGALHMIDEGNGIVKQLTEAGYTVERIK